MDKAFKKTCNLILLPHCQAQLLVQQVVQVMIHYTLTPKKTGIAIEPLNFI